MPRVKLCVKQDKGKVALSEFDYPDPGPGQALVRTTLTTICGSDIHIVDDIDEVMPGTPMGHEAVGVVEAVGEGVERFKPGDRVVACCLTSCGQCERCREGNMQLCSTYGSPMNLLFGAQGEAFLVNSADHSMAKLPDGLDERGALFAADILSTGLGAVERGGVKPGDAVAIFAQGPVGLCATMAARMAGAEPIIAVESVPERVEMAKRLGAHEVVSPESAVEEIMKLTGARGVDVAIEALGKQETFENCCRVTRLGGTVSSVGVYGGLEALRLPLDPGFIQRQIVTTLCPAGRERLEYLLGLIESGKLDPRPLLTHDRRLDEIVETYDVFRRHADGMIKVAITP
ncbi:MAG: NAD(P)-dependent alcohol dehydrogenase [Candidatus Dadabacteria bacterium]|nr:MAG: NAD(P)-dependent alcohol dehydrogenase [Candidatus Dadabacteria bacterium]